MNNTCCFHVYTGDGKGKTTAALGLALRAAGCSRRVMIIQFLKTDKTCEHQAVKKIPEIEIKSFGTGRFLSGEPSEQDIAEAEKGMDSACQALCSGEYDMVVLDEICVALNFSLVDINELLDMIRKRHEGVEVIATGRNAPKQLIQAADLVTDMKNIKHYYEQGVSAREGIEQ